MTPVAVSLWITNVVLETAGQLALKSAASGHDAPAITRWRRMIHTPLLWAGVVCFVFQFVAWFGLLSLIPLSQAMLINSINIVAVMVAGRFVFHERLSAMRVAGASLVSIGVALAGVSA